MNERGSLAVDMLRDDLVVAIKDALRRTILAREVEDAGVVIETGGVQCLGDNKYRFAAIVDGTYQVEVTWEVTVHSHKLFGNIVVRRFKQMVWQAGFTGVCFAGDIVQFMDNPAVHGRRLCLLQVPPEEDAERTFECQGAEFRFIIDFGGVFSKFTAEEIVRGKAGACAARLHWRGGLMA
jgi:hypothetical protein